MASFAADMLMASIFLFYILSYMFSKNHHTSSLANKYYVGLLKENNVLDMWVKKVINEVEHW